MREAQLLMAKAQNGCKVSYEKGLRRIVNHINDSPLCENIPVDLRQKFTDEVLLGVHRALRTYDPKRDFQPWLEAIVIYKSKQIFSKRSKFYLLNRFEEISKKRPSNTERTRRFLAFHFNLKKSKEIF